MPKIFTAAFNRFRDRLFRTLFRARFRYDVFISYNHAAKAYAVNLKRQLADLDFTCFIDEEEAPPGSSLDPTLARALSKSAVMVLLATERALTRPYIMLEFEKFVSTDRRIIPINIGSALSASGEAALARAPWSIIKSRNLIWIDEADEAFAKQIPSPPIADGIDKLFKYTRRNSRVRTEIIGTATLVVLAAIAAGFVIKGQATEVSTQTARASAARIEANKQQDIATEAGREAQKQLALAAKATDEAKRQTQIAETAKKEADRQQEIARTATAEANKQLMLAKAARAEAERQQAIAAEQSERNRHLRYVSEISFGERAYETGDMTRLTEFLDARVSAPDSSADDLRGFEWYYLWRLRHNEMGTIGSQKDAVKDIRFSPDGRTLLTIGTGKGNTLKLFSASTWQPIGEFEGYSAKVAEVVFSPDSQTVAVIDDEHNLTLWDVNSRRQLWVLGGPTWVGTFAPDSKTVVTGGSEPTVSLWNVASHTKINELTIPNSDVPKQQPTRSRRRSTSEKEKEAAVTTIEFSPDGKKLTAAGYRNQVAMLWDAITGKELMILKAKEASDSVWLKFSPDGKKILSYGFATPVRVFDSTTLTEVGSLGQGAHRLTFSPDGKTVFINFYDLKLWDLSSQTELGTIEERSDDIDFAVFSPNDRILATTGRNSMVQLWDLNGRELVRMQLGKYAAESLEYSRTGRMLVARSNDGSMRMWDMSLPGATLKLRAYGSAVSALALSPQGDCLIAVDGGIVKRWDTNSQREAATLTGHSPYLSYFEFVNGGRILGTKGRDESLKLWDITTRKPIGVENPGRRGLSNGLAAFSHDGRTLALAHEYSDNVVQLKELMTERDLGLLKGLTSNVLSLEFSPDDKILATGTEDNTITLWNTTSFQPLTKLAAHTFSQRSQMFSPDGKLFAAGADEYSIKLWDTSSWKEVGSLPRNSGRIVFILFSANSAIVASVASNSVKLWNVATRKELTTVEGYFEERSAVALSPNGKILAVRNNQKDMFVLLDTSGHELATLRGQPNVSCLAFSPDGKTLAAGSEDGTVKLWEVLTGQELAAFRDHSSAIAALSFSPDGKTLATGSRDSTVRLLFAATESDVANQKSVVPAP